MDFKTHDESLDKNVVKTATNKMLERIGELQNLMFAENKHSLLIVLQGMDASGKDGIIRGLISGCNPSGFSVKSFVKPTVEEYAHDFLWRVHQHAPAKGQIQIFNRSHYEDILVPEVEKLFPAEVIEARYELINNFEKLLEHNGTIVLKFFLNVSKAVQEKRLRERIEMERKYWKHNDSDWATREKWDEYMTVYEKILTRCNITPWYVVPADTNWQKLYFTAKKVLETLESLQMKWPPLESTIFRQKNNSHD